MDSETLNFIENCIHPEGLYAYKPYLSDTPKTYTDSTFIFNNSLSFIKTYISLGASYPSEYINAVLSTNLGYLYIFDRSHPYIINIGNYPGLGYIQTLEITGELAKENIYKKSFFPKLHGLLEIITGKNILCKIPLLNIIIAPGIWLNLLLLFTGIIFHEKRYELLLPLAFLGGLYLTMLLGPTVQLRYVFPIMITVPSLFLAKFTNTSRL